MATGSAARAGSVFTGADFPTFEFMPGGNRGSQSAEVVGGATAAGELEAAVGVAPAASRSSASYSLFRSGSSNRPFASSSSSSSFDDALAFDPGRKPDAAHRFVGSDSNLRHVPFKVRQPEQLIMIGFRQVCGEPQPFDIGIEVGHDVTFGRTGNRNGRTADSQQQPTAKLYGKPQPGSSQWFAAKSRGKESNAAAATENAWNGRSTRQLARELKNEAPPCRAEMPPPGRQYASPKLDNDNDPTRGFCRRKSIHLKQLWN